MADQNRRTFLKLTSGIGTIGMTGLAGCSGGNGGSGGQSGGGDTTTESDPFNVGMVYALGGLGDKSFNDMALQGVKHAKEKYDITYKNTEPGSVNDIETFQRKLAQSTSPTYELVTTVGYVQATPLQQNAERFPDQKFTIIDSVVDKPNVASYTFKEHQGSFQVGHLGGLLTARDFSTTYTANGSEHTVSTNPDDLVVGFVGGKQTSLIKKFQAGYEAGAKYADENIEVRSAYVGAWNDPSKAKEIALSMYDEGADIVYHAAGGSGIGVFKAAMEKGRYAIGVDSDQSKSTDFEEVILASMVKHVDTAVFESIGNVVQGKFKGGSHVRLGLQDGGVEAIYGQAVGDAIPQSVKDKLDQSKQAIVSGEIDVPTEPKNA
ncbi:BMP family lipoprotein [Halospeciosus flavus]|uniref:BMP family protein n=1 Tax=Halospeciosus flavus TaxID=3032283 RepID=A0ABD5Z446_9EURY|nr:BMP family protein [Halospeciosus flavus]